MSGKKNKQLTLLLRRYKNSYKNSVFFTSKLQKVLPPKRKKKTQCKIIMGS